MDFTGMEKWLPDIGLSGIVALFFIALFTGRLVTSQSMAKAYEALESRAKTAENREAVANARTETALRVIELQGKQLDLVVEQNTAMLAIVRALPHGPAGGKGNAE